MKVFRVQNLQINGKFMEKEVKNIQNLWRKFQNGRLISSPQNPMGGG
jgi:hypothetical protein